MKKIKSILALAAAFAVAAGVAQAVTPVTFSLTAYVKPGAVIQGISINNAQLLQQFGAALHANLSSAKLCVDTNGNLVITDAAGVILYDLSAGAGSNWVTSITPGVNHAVITNYTQGFVEVFGASPFGNAFSFWDPIFTGTQTPDVDTNILAEITRLGFPVEFVPGSHAFDVKARAVAGFFEIQFGYDTYSRSSLNPNNPVHHIEVYEDIDVCDSASATVACSLAAGVYKQSFNISAAGEFYSTQFGEGVMWGTVSTSGTQTGGQTFLDPFNAPFNEFDLGGNYGLFYDTSDDDEED